MRQKTKIVCTIGPATWDENVLKTLIDTGLTVARINASFADAAEIKRVTALIRSLSDRVAVLLDLKGHKIRVSDFGDPIQLEAGQDFILDTNPDSEHVSVSYENLHKDIAVGASILLDDGKVHMQVKAIEGTKIICIVKNTAELKRLKTVNVPGTRLSFDPLTEKDKVDIQAGVECDVDLIAGSFVRDVEDVRAIKERIEGTDIGIIAKIEDPLGVRNFDEILENVYGIMVARGDLGVEIPYEQVPILQKEFIKKCNILGKPVIVATHMLESMTNSPAPTRAEVSDVANAVFDGTDAIMTSAETSTGAYPVEAITTMAKVSLNVEKMSESKSYDDNAETILKYNGKESNAFTRSSIAIAKATAEACRNLPIAAIIVLSKGGFTARMIARHHLKQPIYTYVRKEKAAKQLALTHGVSAKLLESQDQDRDSAIKRIIAEAKSDGAVKPGDLVAVTIGSLAFVDTHASILDIQTVE